MTPNEFKAWFDGFTEAFEGRIPTKAQWGRIKERVAEIDGKPVTERIYVDRYWPTYIRSVPSYPITTWTNCVATGATGGATGNTALQNVSGSAGTLAFNSTQAMSDLGRYEAARLS